MAENSHVSSPIPLGEFNKSRQINPAVFTYTQDQIQQLFLDGDTFRGGGNLQASKPNTPAFNTVARLEQSFSPEQMDVILMTDHLLGKLAVGKQVTSLDATTNKLHYVTKFPPLAAEISQKMAEGQTLASATFESIDNVFDRFVQIYPHYIDALRTMMLSSAGNKGTALAVSIGTLPILKMLHEETKIEEIITQFPSVDGFAASVNTMDGEQVAILCLGRTFAASIIRALNLVKESELARIQTNLPEEQKAIHTYIYPLSRLLDEHLQTLLSTPLSIDTKKQEKTEKSHSLENLSHL